jgi:hypothetical protein
VHSLKAVQRPCGNPECAVSTTIADTLSFGSGHLDDYGFWEFPCRVCAAATEARDRARGLDKERPDLFPYWPEGEPQP